MAEEVIHGTSSPAYREPKVAEPWSLESEADHLMDDLFSGVDVMLDGGSQLPTKPIQRDYVSLRPVVPAELTRSTTPPPVSPQRSVVTTPQSKAAAAPQGSRQAALVRHLDKVFFAIACLSLVGVVAWLVTQGKLNLQRFQPAPTNSAAPNPALGELPPEDAAFGEYMLRSLNAIDRRPPSPAAAAPQTSLQANLTAPPQDTAAPSSPQVIERVYIPVYPPNPNTAQSSTGTPPRSAAPNLSENAPTSPAPLPRASTARGPIPRFPAAASVAPSVTRPQQQVLPPLPALDDIPAAAPTVPLPPGDNKLVGILEYGDRSTALFMVGDSTQRISVGEPIGDSGWTLVSTENKQATVRRNGEVRSIYVGQTF